MLMEVVLVAMELATGLTEAMGVTVVMGLTVATAVTVGLMVMGLIALQTIIQAPVYPVASTPMEKNGVVAINPVTNMSIPLAMGIIHMDLVFKGTQVMR